MSFVPPVETTSEEETRAFGAVLATMLPEHAVVLLIGNLGAGKTTLTKGLVEGRGAARADDVSSPTFSLIHEYGEPVKIYHVDLYRLESALQAQRLGLEELFDSPALVIMEWGERFPELLPTRRFEVCLTHLGEDRRLIEVAAIGL